MEIKIAGIVNESVVDGPGIRRVIFTQGCPHHCCGCHNPQSHDFDGGFWSDTEEILADFASFPLLAGLTLSGGEPLEQPAPCAELAFQVQKMAKNIVLYSGYTWEQLLVKARQNQDIQRLLLNTDFLIDGPYLEEKRSLDLLFRGSANQRIIDVQQSLKNNTIQLAIWGRNKPDQFR